MPRTSLDRMSPDKVRQRFAWELRKTIDSHRVANTPTYESIAAQIGIGRRTMCSRLQTGNLTFEEFAGIARILRFSEQEICRLVKERAAG